MSTVNLLEHLEVLVINLNQRLEDAQMLQETFAELRANVKLCSNLSGDALIHKIKKYVNRATTGFVLIILADGDKDYISTNDGGFDRRRITDEIAHRINVYKVVIFDGDVYEDELEFEELDDVIPMLSILQSTIIAKSVDGESGNSFCTGNRSWYVKALVRRIKAGALHGEEVVNILKNVGEDVMRKAQENNVEQTPAVQKFAISHRLIFSWEDSLPER